MPIVIRDTKVRSSKKSTMFETWLSLWRTDFPLKMCNRDIKLYTKCNRLIGSKITKDKKGCFWLNLSMEFNSDDRTITKNSKVLGVDLGIAKPIVCSDGKQFGNGRLIKHKKIEFGKRRGKDQSKNKVIIDKQRRWQKDTNHKISRQLINHCVQENIDVLCLEKLKGQELSNKKYRKYSWAFEELLMFIKQKAMECGIKVVSVNPAYTSQTCSNCGSKRKSNRKTQSLFECDSCGFRANADVNAAKNILGLSVGRWGKLTMPTVRLKPEPLPA